GSPLEPASIRIEPVELARELDDGAITASSDIGNDRTYGRLDVGRCLAFGGEKSAETLGEIGGAAVEADRHGPVLPDQTGRIRGQWLGPEGPSTPPVRRILGVDWPRGRRPRGSQIGELGLQAFDLEPQRSPSRENKFHDACRR